MNQSLLVISSSLWLRQMTNTLFLFLPKKSERLATFKTFYYWTHYHWHMPVMLWRSKLYLSSWMSLITKRTVKHLYALSRPNSAVFCLPISGSNPFRPRYFLCADYYAVPNKISSSLPPRHYHLLVSSFSLLCCACWGGVIKVAAWNKHTTTNT